MALSDKVLQAQATAKYVKQSQNYVFDNINDNGNFLILRNMNGDEIKIVEFPTTQEANLAKDNLNAAIAVVKSNITVSLEQKVDDIINA